MITRTDLCGGGIYTLHDDEDNCYRLSKIISINGNDIWVILHREVHEDIPSLNNRGPSVTIRTSVDAFLTWATSEQSRIIQVEPVTDVETGSCDSILYPDNPLQQVNPLSVR